MCSRNTALTAKHAVIEAFCLPEQRNGRQDGRSSRDTDRQVLLEHATSSNIGGSPLQATGGDDHPLGVIPNLQGPLPGTAAVLQPGISVQRVEVLVELLLQGVPQQQVATLLALCQQSQSGACGFEDVAGLSGLFCSDAHAQTRSMT